MSRKRSGKRQGPGPKYPSSHDPRLPKKKTSRAAATEAIPLQRIQKLLANAGYGSRREVESWLAAGRIQLNGRPAGPGDKAGEGDRLSLDGKPLRLDAGMMPERRVLIYHKPVGEMSTRRDPEGRPTIFDRIPAPQRGRWVSVGRLDFNTAGLMILTTDGQLAARLMHPSRQLVREYAVRVRGEVAPELLDKLRSGVKLDDGPARFEEIVDTGGQGQNHWYHVILREGRYREVRRLWEAVGATVSRLIRVRYGPLSLPGDLPRGHWRELGAGQVRALMDAAGLEPEAPLAEASDKKAQSGRRFKPNRD
ncbi:pseudouridine synthase [Gammaproteobacteria bacterium AB-CW1]|uniref:Pseudouridine synthase n=1 Tax=Natronospira elongata TaxID=3110268 RepID=A0AAP6MMW3_9GAMM|nr:pseudouridine synthase [Gammaproteobacteria bacterium AB-CW1]